MTCCLPARPIPSQLAISTFRTMGQLSGLVPLVGIASGFTFAGNAALLGLCDVVTATATHALHSPVLSHPISCHLSARPLRTW
jgi:hypothetical protein